MKQLYAFLFLVSSGAFKAQTLTQSFNEPTVGDVDKSTRLDTLAYTTGLPINVMGNNCVWDFTKLTGFFPYVVDSIILPSAAPSASTFPTASFVQNRNGIYTFYKSSTSPSQTELLGGYTNTLSLTFSNTAIIASYPTSYGSNMVDPVSGTFKYNTQNGGCNGSITVVADGLGTVNLPNGLSVPNVLRIRSVQVLTLSTGIFPVGTFNQNVYNYYLPGKKYPILNIAYATYQLFTGTPTITALVNGSQNYFSVVGLNEKTISYEEYRAYPNPFHDVINITANNEQNEYVFYNISGQMVLRTKSNKDAEIEKLKSGIYFLEIRNEWGIHRQKVVKE